MMFNFNNNLKTKFRLFGESGAKSRGLPSTTFATASVLDKNNSDTRRFYRLHNNDTGKSGAGFTLIQLVIALAILAIVGMISIPSIMYLVKLPPLNSAAEEIISTLKLAQNKTISSEGNSQYGVYFKMVTDPHELILFKGQSYELRDQAFDKSYPLPLSVELYGTDLGGGSEIVFDKLTGSTANAGSISLRLKNDTDQVKIVYIDNSGIVDYTLPSTPSDQARTKDSRHIHFDYNRIIDVYNENIVLTFDGNIVEIIPMIDQISDGQFDWQDTVTVNGQDQTIRIHTLRLNSQDTQFSIFRDLRFNNASLNISISGDNTGTVAEYSANGLTTNFSSIYVNNFAWQ